MAALYFISDIGHEQTLSGERSKGSNIGREGPVPGTLRKYEFINEWSAWMSQKSLEFQVRKLVGL